MKSDYTDVLRVMLSHPATRTALHDHELTAIERALDEIVAARARITELEGERDVALANYGIAKRNEQTVRECLTAETRAALARAEAAEGREAQLREAVVAIVNAGVPIPGYSGTRMVPAGYIDGAAALVIAQAAQPNDDQTQPNRNQSPGATAQGEGS